MESLPNYFSKITNLKKTNEKQQPKLMTNAEAIGLHLANYRLHVSIALKLSIAVVIVDNVFGA